MPNRKTFDADDRYDHSSHSTLKNEPGDLRSTPHEADATAARPEVPSDEMPPQRGAPRKTDSD